MSYIKKSVQMNCPDEEKASEIVLPAWVTAIDRQAHRDFYIQKGVLTCYLGAKSEVAIPAGVTAIGNAAFDRCPTLRAVTIPEGLTHIGTGAFSNCKNLSRVVLPSTLESVGINAFHGCSPDLVVVHGGAPFSCDFSLMPAKMKYLLAVARLRDSVNFSQKTAASVDRYIARRANFFFGALRGDDGAGLSALLSRIAVKLPQMLEWLDRCGAAGRTKMQAVLLDYRDRHFSAQELTAYAEAMIEKELGLRERTLSEWRKLFAISLCDGGYRISHCKTADETVEIPGSIGGKPVLQIGDCAFDRNKTLRSLMIRQGVRNIGKHAFLYCTALVNIRFSEDLSAIGFGAFCGCRTLGRVTLPEGVRRISDYAFYGCGALESVYIPDSVTEIGKDAFGVCQNLTIHAREGSLAEQYAKSYGIPFEAT